MFAAARVIVKVWISVQAEIPVCKNLGYLYRNAKPERLFHGFHNGQGTDPFLQIRFGSYSFIHIPGVLFDIVLVFPGMVGFRFEPEKLIMQFVIFVQLGCLL